MTNGSGVADLARIFRDFRLNPPADAQIIEKCEQGLGVVLPDAYKRFLQHANGGEGPIGPASYAQLWLVDDLVDNNNGYEVNQFAPGIVLFGSNGGGEAFAFDYRAKPQIISIPFIFEFEYALVIGLDFDAFLLALYERSDGE